MTLPLTMLLLLAAFLVGFTIGRMRDFTVTLRLPDGTTEDRPVQGAHLNVNLTSEPGINVAIDWTRNGTTVGRRHWSAQP